jgi:hypothetical protein
MRYAKRVSAVVGAVLAMACGSESPSAPIATSAIVGTYSVTRFNGAAVPAAVIATVTPSSTTTWTLVSGTLELHADGTWSIVYPMRFATTGGQTGASDPIPHDVGTYSVSGMILTLRDSTARTTITADVTGSAVVMRSGLVNAFGFATLEFTRP